MKLHGLVISEQDIQRLAMRGFPKSELRKLSQDELIGAIKYLQAGQEGVGALRYRVEKATGGGIKPGDTPEEIAAKQEAFRKKVTTPTKEPPSEFPPESASPGAEPAAPKPESAATLPTTTKPGGGALMRTPFGKKVYGNMNKMMIDLPKAIENAAGDPGQLEHVVRTYIGQLAQIRQSAQNMIKEADKL